MTTAWYVYTSSGLGCMSRGRAAKSDEATVRTASKATRAQPSWLQIENGLRAPAALYSEHAGYGCRNEWGHVTWPPATEADLLSALAAGDIAESNNLDVKTLIGDSDRSRRDTAKDLASFAVDGGALLIGVREHKDTRTFECAPVDLHDSLERIEQIAANRIDPPLVVHPREITSAISGLGYIWVDIPASPDAPHMVDGRYYGRGERTNRSLPDAEVLRLHRLNAGFQTSTAGALDALQLKDPYLQPGRTGAEGHLSPPAFGHLYLVATPRRASPRLAQDLIWDRYEELFPLIGQAEKSVPSALRNYGPHLQGFSPEVRSSSVVLTNLLQDPLESEGT